MGRDVGLVSKLRQTLRSFETGRRHVARDVGKK
jgi:hypothetical protein